MYKESKVEGLREISGDDIMDMNGMGAITYNSNVYTNVDIATNVYAAIAGVGIVWTAVGAVDIAILD